jgi:hypothetical protein
MITASGLYVPPIGFRPALLQDPDLGRVYVPKGLRDLVSYPGRPCRPRHGPGEVGVVIGAHHRPEYDEDRHGNLFIRRMRLLWASITHNERVDAGASQQARQVFGGGSSPGAPSATAYPKAIAVASATLTKSKGDQSLGTTTQGSTANEFTTIGLSRALADTPVAGDYTVPGSLGGQFRHVGVAGGQRHPDRDDHDQQLRGGPMASTDTDTGTAVGSENGDGCRAPFRAYVGVEDEPTDVAAYRHGDRYTIVVLTTRPVQLRFPRSAFTSASDDDAVAYWRGLSLWLAGHADCVVEVGADRATGDVWFACDHPTRAPLAGKYWYVWSLSGLAQRLAWLRGRGVRVPDVAFDRIGADLAAGVEVSTSGDAAAEAGAG